MFCVEVMAFRPYVYVITKHAYKGMSMETTTNPETREIGMAAFVAEMIEQANKAARRAGYANRAEQVKAEAAKASNRRFSGAHYVGR